VRDPSRLVTYLDTFTLDGYEGKKHRVLVFPARGPSLQSCLKEMPMQSRMSAAKQSLEALESLHRSGFVHRGKFPAACSTLRPS
jgi:serine/threonine protein kinase